MAPYGANRGPQLGVRHKTAESNYGNVVFQQPKGNTKPMPLFKVLIIAPDNNPL